MLNPVVAHGKNLVVIDQCPADIAGMEGNSMRVLAYLSGVSV